VDREQIVRIDRTAFSNTIGVDTVQLAARHCAVAGVPLQEAPERKERCANAID